MAKMAADRGGEEKWNKCFNGSGRTGSGEKPEKNEKNHKIIFFSWQMRII